MAELESRYEADIYRPGDDVTKLSLLSNEEKSERRRQIEEIFADPEAYEAAQQERYRQADEEAARGTEPVTIHVE